MDLLSIKGGRKRRLYQRRVGRAESLPRVQSMTRKQIKHQPFACTWLPSHSFPNLLSSKANLTLRNPRRCPMLTLKMKKQTKPGFFWCLTSVVTAGDRCWCGPQLHLPSVLTLAFINEWAHLPCLTPWLWLLVDQFHYSFSTDQYHQAFIMLQCL